MRILVINGPNLNMLGVREPDIYGQKTYSDLCVLIEDFAKENGIDVELYQSNYEGDIVTKIQQAYGKFDGIVINPAAYTHTSVAILDALKAVGIRTCEVHISDVNERESFRHLSYVSYYAEKSFIGLGFDGYIEALKCLTA